MNNPNSLSSNHETTSPREKFGVDPADYPIFSQQSELDHRWGNNSGIQWNLNKTLSYMVTDTADLISVIDGTAAQYKGKGEGLKPDYVIYLDKSARPVSWLVNSFWDTFSDEKRPPHSYLAIDRSDWFRRSGVECDDDGKILDDNGERRVGTFADFKKEGIKPEDFARIRSLFIKGGIQTEDPEEIMNTEAQLDGKRVLIIDEVKRSGSTLEIAKWLLEQSFKDITITTDYFWESGAKISPDGTERQILSVPVWYDPSSPYGRGVDDISESFYKKFHEKYNTDYTRAYNYGSIIKGAMLDLSREPGQKSRQLATEIIKMTEDYKSGKILPNLPREGKRPREKFFKEVESSGLVFTSDESVKNSYLNTKKYLWEKK